MNLNMIAGAFLATVFAVMTVGMVSGAIFYSEEPEQAGFAIIAEEGAGTAAPVEEALPPISPLLAEADIAAGEAAFRKCAACHNDEPGGATLVGPNLWNIVNRGVTDYEGDFNYSNAMQEYAASDGGRIWDYESLNRFINDPRDYISGTSMGFAGISRESERADLIAYLRTTADTPAALPTAEEIEALTAPAEDETMAEEASMEGDTMTDGEAPAEDAMSDETMADDAMEDAATEAEDTMEDMADEVMEDATDTMTEETPAAE